MKGISDSVTVKVVDKSDEMFDFVGDVQWIGDDGKICVYFDDIPITLIYDETQLEVVKKS